MSASIDASTLAKVPIFQPLSPEDHAELAKRLVTKSFAPNATIFHQGDPAGAMYVIVEGSVRIVITPEDKEVVVASLSAGDFFGEMSLMDGKPRSAGAICGALATTCAVLDKAHFLEFISGRPLVAVKMMGVFAERIRKTDDLMKSLVTKNVNDAAESELTFGDRLADGVARFGGSWWFVIFFASVVLLWMAVNAKLVFDKPFDEYPFQFLNLVLGVIAAMQAPFIMMSQNRQSEKERLQSDLDYKVNLKNELAIGRLHQKVDALNDKLAALEPAKSAEKVA